MKKFLLLFLLSAAVAAAAADPFELPKGTTVISRDDTGKTWAFNGTLKRSMNDTKAPPNGECIRDFRTRVIRGFEEVRRRHSIRTLELRHHEEDALSIVICHGGTISAIMNYIWPGVHDNMYGWLPDPGHGYILHLTDDTIKEYERF